jgi:hypothetical protein
LSRRIAFSILSLCLILWLRSFSTAKEPKVRYIVLKLLLLAELYSP